MLVSGTGFSGFIGSYIAQRLASEPDVRVRALVRVGGRREILLAAAPEAEILTGDIDDAADLRRLVEGADAVVHVAYDNLGQNLSKSFYGAAPGEESEWRGEAGTVFRREFIAHNLLSPLELLAAAREAGVKHFVYISSPAVYGRQPHDGPTGEDSVPAPKNAYSSFKVAAEAFCGSFIRFFPAMTIFRPPLVIGLDPKRERSIYWEIAVKIARGEPVEAAGGSNTTRVQEVAEAVAQALRKPALAGGAINLADRYTDIAEVAEILKELAGSKSEITVGKRRGAPESPTPHARAEALGVKYPGRDGLRECLAEVLEAVRKV